MRKGRFTEDQMVRYPPARPEQLLEAALSIDSRTSLIALLGGEGGCDGEIVAWSGTTLDLERRADQHSPLGLARATDDRRTAGTVRGDDRTCGDGPSDAPSPTQLTHPVQGRWATDHSARCMVTRSLRRASCERANRRPHPSSYVLLAPGDARCSNAVGAGAGGPPGSDDDPTVFAPESGRVIDTVRLLEPRTVESAGGEILETLKAAVEVEVLERVKWLGGRDSNSELGVSKLVMARDFWC